ncbi:RING zinc finger-containing protein [Dictyostelium discoideum AX4]|uniref:RING zinc finger-containing protein n=2 Tax=Dictyostelium discoideum TaxID=44689 RepID=Q54EK0_DICDI|nr:RING zinc finger-containing protein [Dictyostelium discoideum AX4]EAL61787.1 RING zinc finger-containing protein [Dictyostelium discoideum AX4]|eukprot:XP_635240.1 RING zinc finger-containing protein [Dictyostelium discoideum AX4]
MNKNNNNNNTPTSSWKSGTTKPTTTTTTTNTTTTNNNPTSPNKTQTSNDLDIVSILSAPPPSTKRVFDPTSTPIKDKKSTGSTGSNSSGSNSNLSSPTKSLTIEQQQQQQSIGRNNSFNIGSLKANSLSNSSTSIGSDVNFINDPKLKNTNNNNKQQQQPINKELIDSILNDDINDDEDDEVGEIIINNNSTINNFNSDTESDSEEVDPEILKKILNEQDDDIIIDESMTVDDILKEVATQEDQEESELLNEFIKSPILSQIQQELDIMESQQPMLWQSRNNRLVVNGIVVEPQSYTKISEQLSSSDIRKVVGYPTCFTVSKFICIGTSHGYLMIFNFNQELLSIIGGSICSDCGPVTAIDSPSCRVNEDWLVSGHQSGHIILWDIVGGKPIKVIDRIHKLPLVHLKFFADGARFVSSDSNGITNIISITKGFMSIGTDQQLLLNGNLGPVLSIALLLPGNHDHPTDRQGIVALATSRKILIISTSSDGVSILNNKITKPKNINNNSASEGGSGGALPYLSWRRVIYNRSLGHTKPLEPILAIGWGTSIQLLQIVTAPNDFKFQAPEFIVVANYQTDHTICGLEWLDSQTILFQNSKDELRVFDPFALEEVESVNIKSMQLIHHSKYQGISVYSFHSSIKTLKSRIYFLGLNGLFTAHILTWIERLSILTTNGQWFEALCLALDFYEGKAKACTGLSSNTVDSKYITSEKIVEIISNLCQSIFNITQPELLAGKSLIPKSYYQQMDPRIEYLNIYQQLALISIEFCIAIKRTDLLFGEVFNYFFDNDMKSCILDFLEPYILNDRLTHLNPEVMQYMMTYYQDLGILVRAEQCVLHLDISSIDFHQTVVLCRKHGLYSALIYLYNKGLNDYITPMEDMMEVVIKPNNLNNQPTEMDKNSKSVAQRLLLYLQLSLSGKSFPSGLIAPSRVLSLKSEIYEYLFLWNIDPDDPTPYPRIYNLLKMDTTELLKILSLGFYDKGFQMSPNQQQQPQQQQQQQQQQNENNENYLDETIPQLSVPNLPLNFPVSRSNLTTFNMISVLLLIVIDKSQHPYELKPNNKWPFSFQQQGQLLCILGKVFIDGLFRVDNNLLNRIIGMLSVTPIENTPMFDLKTRQSVLLDILKIILNNNNKNNKNNNGGMANLGSDINYDKLLVSCEGNEFFKVCQYIYSIKNNFNRMITCQIKDPDNKQHSFDYIREILARPSLTIEQRETVKNTSISNLAQLILIDSVKTAQLIMDCFSSDHEKVLRELSSFPKLQFTYLQGLFKKGTTSSNNNNGNNNGNNNSNNNNNNNNNGNGNNNNNDLSIIQQYGIHISQETHELYLRLMCNFSPELVIRYLSSNDDYPLDSCLKICQQFNNLEGSIYLLERIGDVFKALDMLLLILKDKLDELLKYYVQVFANVKQLKESDGNNNLQAPSKQEKQVMTDLYSAISLCQRNSPKLQDSENEPLWFRLFDTIVTCIQRIKQQSNQGVFSKQSAIYWKSLNFLSKLVHSILNSMMGYVALPVILSRIVNEYGGNELGDFKSIITDMMDTCTFETIILKTANDLIQADMFSATQTFVEKLSRAYTPNISKCGMCYRPLSEAPIAKQQPNHTMALDTLIVYQCNHTFHSECLGKHKVCPLCSKEKERKKLPSSLTSNNNNINNKTVHQQQQQQKEKEKEKEDEELLDAVKFDVSKYEKEKTQKETAKYMERLENYSKLNRRIGYSNYTAFKSFESHDKEQKSQKPKGRVQQHMQQHQQQQQQQQKQRQRR